MLKNKKFDDLSLEELQKMKQNFDDFQTKSISIIEESDLASQITDDVISKVCKFFAEDHFKIDGFLLETKIDDPSYLKSNDNSSDFLGFVDPEDSENHQDQIEDIILNELQSPPTAKHSRNKINFNVRAFEYLE